MLQKALDFIKGKKTFAIAITAIIVAILKWQEIEIPEEVWAVLAALGLAFLRAGVKAIEDTPTKKGFADAGLLAGLAGAGFLAVLCAGCGGSDFITEAPVAIARGAVELETGLDEYHAACVEEMDRAAARQQNALKEDLAEYIVAVVDSGAAPGTISIDSARQRIAVNFAKYEEQVESLNGERAIETQRYSTMKSLCGWVRKLAAQIVEIETRRYATVEELRDLAVQQVRSQIKEEGHE